MELKSLLGGNLLPLDKRFYCSMPASRNVGDGISLGMINLRNVVVVLFAAMLLAVPVVQADPAMASPESQLILSRYLDASQSHEAVLRGVSMEVDIDASLPKLKKAGKLRALRSISKVGRITYRVLGFQGDDTIKKDVIGRYLTAEQQTQQTDDKYAITPANYKFKFKGKQRLENGREAYAFQLQPKKKAVGLFKGEMWLDANTYLPVVERGRLVKNPSIFFKKVDFERQFAILNGVAVPQRMNSRINTRMFGTVEVNINYSHFASTATTSEVSSVFHTAGTE